VAGRIGILALQGAFAKHEDVLKKMAVPHCQVRYAQDLAACEGLIIPGGESTTMTRHIQERHLAEPLKAFAKRHPVFGTCAGMIVMAREGILSLLSISVERNAYGRQRDSFISPLPLPFISKTVEAFFIRAPRISAIHAPDVKILGELSDEPVLIQQGFHLAASFHPELTNECAIHQYFIEICRSKQSLRQQSTTTPIRSFQTT
jgi:5'-phosphate synthase pdxT subunit